MALQSRQRISRPWLEGARGGGERRKLPAKGANTDPEISVSSLTESGAYRRAASLDRQRTTPPRAEAMFVVVSYSALVVWWLWPLPRLLFTHAGYFAPHALATADFYLITWALAWDAHAIVTAPWRIFDANAFYPSPLSLAFSEHFLGYMPVFAPVYWITENPILAVNLLVLTSYPLCGLAMYLLARRFTGGPAAAVAGFFYAFCMWRYESLTHFHLLGVQYMPLALLLSERWFEEARRRDALLLILVLVLQGLSSFYLAYALAFFYGPYLLLGLWRWRARCDRRRILGLAIVLTAVGIIMTMVSLPYLELRHLGLIPSYGKEGRPLGWIESSAMGVKRHLEAKGVGSLGYALALLAILPPWRGRGWPIVLGILTVVVGIVAACGPRIPVMGHQLPGPYHVLAEWVPGFASVRAVGRLVIVAHLGFSLLAGLGLGRILGRLPVWPAWGVAVGAALAAIVSFGEFLPMPIHQELTGKRVPAAYRWLGQHGESRALLELPPALFDRAAHRMYLSTFHWLPIIGGNSAYPPRTDLYVYSLAGDLPKEPAFKAVVDAVDIGWILVHLDELPAETADRWQGSLPDGLERAGSWGDDLLLRVTRQGRKDIQARLLSTEQTLGGVPLAPLPERCPGELRLTMPPPDPWKPGSKARLKVEVHNTGSSAWPARGFVPRHLVRLAACVSHPSQPSCGADPTPLPDDVPAGGGITVPFTVKAPPWSGPYVLRISLFQVGDGPLERCGVKPLAVPVQVR